MTIINQTKGNELIYQRIWSNKPSAVGKIGTVESGGLLLYLYYKQQHTEPVWSDANDPNIANFTASTLYVNAGVYPPSKKILNKYCELMFSILPEMDILASWQNEGGLITNCAPQAQLVELRSLEPFYHEIPWSLAFKNKTILAISPFAETIKKQFSIRDKVWSTKKVLPNAEIKTIKAPYSTALDTNTPHITWFDALEWMKDQINHTSFDVAIIGAGAYSLPLAVHIKQIGKIGIHIGGGAQIVFGIKGKRWDVHPDISKFYNEYWCRPSKEENPPFKNLIGDGETYW